MSTLWKNKLILFFMFCIAALYVVFLRMDALTPGESISSVLKYACELLCFCIVLLSLRDPYSGYDIKALTAAFCFLLAADALFLFARNYTAGIAVFLFAHIFFIRRYRKKEAFACLIAAVAMVGIVFTFYATGVVLPYIMLLGGLYGILIFLNAAAALHSRLPNPNRLLAFSGMIFFILCDINVAAGFLLNMNRTNVHLPLFFEWLFYVPALVLLALSGLRYAPQQRRYKEALAQRDRKSHA